MRQARKGWFMLDDEARPMLRLISERLKSQRMDVRQRDALIRLRAMIENDIELAADSVEARPKLRVEDAFVARYSSSSSLSSSAGY